MRIFVNMFLDQEYIGGFGVYIYNAAEVEIGPYGIVWPGKNRADNQVTGAKRIRYIYQVETL